MHPRRRTGAAAALARGDSAGIMASSSGSASVAPAPRRNVRRGNDILVIIIGLNQPPHSESRVWVAPCPSGTALPDSCPESPGQDLALRHALRGRHLLGSSFHLKWHALDDARDERRHPEVVLL